MHIYENCDWGKRNLPTKNKLYPNYDHDQLFNVMIDGNIPRKANMTELLYTEKMIIYENKMMDERIYTSKDNNIQLIPELKTLL